MSDTISDSAMKEAAFVAAGGAKAVSPHYSEPLPPTVGALFAKASFTTSESSPDRPGLRITFGFHNRDDAHAAQDEIIRLVKAENARPADDDERPVAADVSSGGTAGAVDSYSGAGVPSAGVVPFWSAYQRHLPSRLRCDEPPPEVRRAIEAGLAALVSEPSQS